MNRNYTLIAVAWTFFAFGMNDLSVGQQVNAENESSKTHKQIVTALQKGQLTIAAQQLDEHLRRHPHDHKIQLLRNGLSNAFFRRGKRKDGEQQIEKFLQYLFDNPKESRPLLRYLPQLLINLSSIQKGIEPQASIVLDKSIQLLGVATGEEPSNAAYSNGLSSAVGLKARVLVQHENWSKAVALYKAELERLRTRWRRSSENPDAWVRLIYLLKSAEETIGLNTAPIARTWNIERTNLMELGLREFPTSTRMVKEYFGNLLKIIGEYEETSPRQALAMYSKAKKDILDTIEKQHVKKALFPLRIDIERKAQQLERSLVRTGLTNKAVPELGEVEWISPKDSGDSTIQFESKPTVLLFWSTSRTSELGELIKFNDQLTTRFPDTRLVVVTHELGETFDKLPFVTVKQQITGEQRKQYRNSLDETVITSNRFTFPIGISKDLLALSNRFGITKTPHALLVIDGKCKLSLSVETDEQLFATLLSSVEAATKLNLGYK